MSLAPITLFVYNRLSNTKKTIESLKKNELARESSLFIFSDGAIDEKDRVKVDEVRKYILKINGFKNINIIKRNQNLGLKENIINGVSDVVKKFGKVIVLEDDLITSPFFLNFMNQGLNFYKGNDKVQSISGFTMNLESLKNYNKDFYFGLRSSSWGWATWDYIWNDIDWEINDYKSFMKSSKLKKSFNKGGSDMSNMLKNTFTGKIDSWAIIFCYDQWKKQRLSVFPVKSKIANLGFNKLASNTKNFIPEYQTKLDDTLKSVFEFDTEGVLNDKITKDFARRFSLYTRIKNKVFNMVKELI